MVVGHNIDFPDLWSLSQRIKTKLPASSASESFRKHNVAAALGHSLDRVNILGDDAGYGHSGCVNALSWASNGEILISSGDDTTVRIWRMDNSNTSQQYPFMCRSVIHTGHRANIFSAKMLPHSSRIVTAAGDMQIRVFDARSATSSSLVSDDLETEYSVDESCLRVIHCHEDRAKKIVTEDSPDLFLSLAEDGTVRQHDLRIPHNCQTEACSAPLVDMGFELSTISVSPLTPYQFVVAGDSPHGYLYDRRHLRRVIEAEWGAIPQAGKGATTCVRKFSRPKADTTSSVPVFLRDHITGSRISKSNGHEVLLSFSGDGVYIFSTKDDSSDDGSMKRGASISTHNSESQDDESSESSEIHRPDEHPGLNAPSILSRQSYTGARNVATIKDVNFIGPHDEWIVSGSDDGNLFIWNKKDASLQGIYEGDSSVVNVVEEHPYLPLLAVSGIDNTVKLFAPNLSDKPSTFSRIANAEEIVSTNRRAGETRILRYDLSTLLSEVRAAVGNESDLSEQCVGQ
ncbi:hypothetical protein CVT24_004049 [Panaeolus cyanescens]|uniref:WD40 repeat-like protein n=1 Tax=Panaeolus cyanescens TaxID=181874 RepID=A0A409Y6I4_9AGAR|nr:hypothetical protein CVT24_004049 [Panaeolus cyanescens]